MSAPPPTIVRAATVADAEAVQALVRGAYGPYAGRMGREPAPMAVDYVARIRQGGVWVALQSERVVGVLVLQVGADHLLVENVAVAPEQQERGVGSRLLALAERRALECGLHELRLYTNEVMTENLAYYARRGFVETHRATSDGFNRVHFSKAVAGAEEIRAGP